MKTKKSSHLGPIKKINAIIVVTIFLTLLFFTILHHESSQNVKEDKIIINIFGKQRMYTQLLSKDAIYLYSLMHSIDHDNTNKLVENVDAEIQEIQTSLKQVSQEFSETFSLLNRGYVTNTSTNFNRKAPIDKSSEFYQKSVRIWTEFEQAIDVLVQNNEINEDVEEAISYIKHNNMELLNLSENILLTILEETNKSARKMELIIYGLIGLLCMITITAVFNLSRYIILPFQQLYKGLSDIGLIHYSSDTNFPTKKKVMPIVNEINQTFVKINDLITLIENMNNNASFAETLDFINNTFSSFIPYNYIGIALIDEKKRELRASYGVSDGTVVGLPEKIMGATWPMKETSLDELIHLGEARIINDLEAYTAKKPLKLYNKIILEAGIKASITLPLKVSGEPVGVIFFSSNKKNVYHKEHLNFLRTLVNSIAISLNQNIFINDLLYSSILALAKLAEARDEDTGEHLDRMKVYARVIAELLYENSEYTDEITLEYIDKIERFSPLHDIGKVGIRDGILLKPGKLTPEEFEEMKQHANYGATVLRTAEQNITKRGKYIFGMGIEIAEGHHEKWNGSGYPLGRKELEIPLSARIVAVADVFDALTSTRPYKEPFSFEKSMRILEEEGGSHFDPVIIKIVLDNKDRFEKVYQGFNLVKHKKE